MRHSHLRLAASLALLVALLSGVAFPAARNVNRANVRVYVTLWFDTEDWTLPGPDDLLLPLCEILEKHRIHATFKMVGEKVRGLERRGQGDVIRALARHDIGFHTTYHSIPPAVTAYLDHVDWLDGIDEFARREGAGFSEVKRVFKRTPVCYGQPGSTWAPQVYGALRRWGVPLYLDEGNQVGLQGQPFYYCGLLNVYNMAGRSTRMGLEGAADYEKGIASFRKIYDGLIEDKGGLVSIYYHPNEFGFTQFWDAVNWTGGANPPRDQWRNPQKRTADSRARAFDYFSRYLDFMQALPGVQFVTGTEMVGLYADRSAGRLFNGGEIASLARAMSREISFQKCGDTYVSAAEGFSLLLRWYLRKSETISVQSISGLLGPYRREEAPAAKLVSKWEFRNSCEDALDAMTRSGHIPNMTWVGAVPVLPADFLATVAAEITAESPGTSVQIRKGNPTLESFAALDSPSLFDWVILPKGFRAPHVMDLARLQCWSLKPATISR